MNEIISKQIGYILPEIRKKGVSTLAVFGSVARGEETVTSDVDVVIEFAPGRKSFDAFMETQFLLEGATGRSIDLVTKESIRKEILPHILKDLYYVS